MRFSIGLTLNCGFGAFFTTMPGILADFKGINTRSPGFRSISEE